MKPALLVCSAVFFAIGYGLGYSAWEKTYGDRQMYALKIGGILALVGLAVSALAG